MKSQKSEKIILCVLLAVPITLSSMCDWVKARFYIDHMERDERLNVIQVERVVDTLQITAGSTLADIGSGSGLFTRHLANRVDPGVVYAVDINSELLEHIDDTAKKQRIDNIKTVQASEDDPNLPRSVDLIFICDTLHYIHFPDRYVNKLRSYVDEGGQIAIINFFRNWPPMSNRFERKQLESWMHQAGFVLKAEHDFLEDRYFLIFERQATVRG
ncbi:MAG: class I SAM-dependent methyltransferase [Deltaproteobacteria bacterium]|nr:class I SAM-dependent methyltransferase [Deltaproteobacteria bacterium]